MRLDVDAQWNQPPSVAAVGSMGRRRGRDLPGRFSHGGGGGGGPRRLVSIRLASTCQSRYNVRRSRSADVGSVRFGYRSTECDYSAAAAVGDELKFHGSSFLVA